jgi:hypothetical protein
MYFFFFSPFLWVGFRPVAPLTTLSKSEDESMGLGFWWSSLRVGWRGGRGLGEV